MYYHFQLNRWCTEKPSTQEGIAVDEDLEYRNRKWPLPRARIGLIIPSVNTHTEPQFNRYAPKGVEIHVQRLASDFDVPLLDQMPKIIEAAELLNDARCDLIVYHCTSKAMGSGMSTGTRVMDAIAQATGRLSATTGTTVVAAFQALRAKKVVLVSPYRQKSNDLEKDFLAETGIRVLRDRALALPTPDGMCGATPEVWINVTLQEHHPEADAYFLSCTNIQSVEAIAELEARLRKPVVTSNQATLWYSLRACGLSDDVPGVGELFRLGLPAST